MVAISTGFVCLKMVGISTSFVCHEQQWLVYLPVLSVMNNTGLYITRFCLLWTMMVGISPSFFLSWTKIGWYINRFCLSWTKMVYIYTGFVGHGQYWLVYQSVLSVGENNGWYITLFCLSWTVIVSIISVIVCSGQK